MTIKVAGGALKAIVALSEGKCPFCHELPKKVENGKCVPHNTAKCMTNHDRNAGLIGRNSYWEKRPDGVYTLRDPQ